jgi:hypothetical protein
MEHHKIHVPNHQPGLILNDIPIVSLIILIYHHYCLKDMNPLYFMVKNHGFIVIAETSRDTGSSPRDCRARVVMGENGDRTG